jgi:hypothetical protein
MGDREAAYRVLVEKGDHLKDPGEDGRIMLKRIFKKWDEGTWTGSIWLRTGTRGQALVNVVTNLWVPQNVGNFMTS